LRSQDIILPILRSGALGDPHGVGLDSRKGVQDGIYLMISSGCILREELDGVGQGIQLCGDGQDLLLGLLGRDLPVSAFQAVLLAMLTFGSAFVTFRLSLAAGIASLGGPDGFTTLSGAKVGIIVRSCWSGVG